MYITLKKPDGSTRQVQEGVEYRLEPGEVPVGSNGNGSGSASGYQFGLLDRLAGYLGIGMAELIYHAADALGIEHCPACEMRYRILHRVEELGFLKTAQLLAKTFKEKQTSPTSGT